MTREQLEILAEKQLSGTLSAEERQLLTEWLNQEGTEELPWPSGDADEAALKMRLFERIRQDAMVTSATVRSISYRRRIWWSAAAVIVLLTSGAAYYFSLMNVKEKPVAAAVHYKGDVAPGHNGAVLHLSGGSTVVLDSVQNGTVATQGTIQAVKVNGELKYVGTTAEILYNTITTDRGRQWQLTLPDGTKVWLNAASSIHYPLAFTGKERVVEVTGEAYFEVAHNAGQPFKVKAGDEVIEDVGTAFNINAYTDEPAQQTTLVEGSVKVNVVGERQVTLKPGQQVREANGALQVSTADIDRTTAWRRGVFSYHHASVAELMRQLARWYNVEVKYEGVVPADETFSGEMGRDLTLAQVLHGLKGMNVHFAIEEDKRIVIMP